MSPFALFDIADSRSADAVVISKASAHRAALKKAADLDNIIFREFVGRIRGFMGSKLLKGWVSINPVTMSKCKAAEYGAYGSERKPKSLCNAGRTFPSNSGLDNIINHLIGYFSVACLSLHAGSGSPQLIKGWVPVDAVKMGPCSPAIDIFNKGFGDDKFICDHVGGEPVNSASHDAGCNFVTDDCVCIRPAAKTTSPLDKVLAVIFCATPSEMIRVAAWRIVAGMKRHVSFACRILPGDDKRHPVGSMVSAVMPEYSVPMVSASHPFPAFIRSLNVNFFPKSFHVHKLRYWSGVNIIAPMRAQGGMKNG